MPTKVGGLVFEDFEKPSPAAVVPKKAEQEAQPEEEDDSWRNRWVGEVDLPESEQLQYLTIHPHAHTTTPRVGQEPLLIESKRRFVLFPIQYHEVRVGSLRDLRRV